MKLLYWTISVNDQHDFETIANESIILRNEMNSLLVSCDSIRTSQQKWFAEPVARTHIKSMKKTCIDNVVGFSLLSTLLRSAVFFLFFGLHSEMKLQWTVCKSKAFFMQWNFKGFSNNRPTSTSTLVQLWFNFDQRSRDANLPCHQKQIFYLPLCLNGGEWEANVCQW